MFIDENDVGNRNNLCGIIYTAYEFADLEYQNRVWVRGEGPEMSWYLDALGDLLDSAGVERYLDGSAARYGFTTEMTERLKDFVTELNAFNRALPQGATDEDIITMPGWELVRRKAAAFLDAAVPWLKLNCGGYLMGRWSWGGETFGD